MSIAIRAITKTVKKGSTNPGNITTFSGNALNLTLTLEGSETFDGAEAVWWELHASRTSDPEDVITDVVVENPTGSSVLIPLTGAHLNPEFGGPIGQFWAVVTVVWPEEANRDPETLWTGNHILQRHNASLTNPGPPAPLLRLTLASADARYAPISHTQEISTITGLQTALNTKAPAADLTSEASTRAAADTALQAAIDGLGGSDFDPASPGPIGEDTPSTAVFTAVSGPVGVDNFGGGTFTISGYSRIRSGIMMLGSEYNTRLLAELGVQMKIVMAGNIILGWSSSNGGLDIGPFRSSLQLAFERYDENTVAVNNGTAGVLRDLRIRNLIASGAVILADYTTDTLPDPTLTPYGVVFANDESNHPQPVYSDGTSWCTFGNNGFPEGPA